MQGCPQLDQWEFQCFRGCKVITITYREDKTNRRYYLGPRARFSLHFTKLTYIVFYIFSFNYIFYLYYIISNVCILVKKIIMVNVWYFILETVIKFAYNPMCFVHPWPYIMEWRMTGVCAHMKRERQTPRPILAPLTECGRRWNHCGGSYLSLVSFFPSAIYFL